MMDHFLELSQDPETAFDLHFSLVHDLPQDVTFKTILICLTTAEDQVQALTMLRDLNNHEALLENCASSLSKIPDDLDERINRTVNNTGTICRE